MSDLLLSLVSEDDLESGDDSGHLNDLLDEDLDVGEKLIVSGIVDRLSRMIWVEDGVNSEDWHQLLPLLVTDDVLTEIEQGVFDRLLQRFLKRIVKTVDELQPFFLNLGVSLDEQVVSLHHLLGDLLERRDNFILLDLQSLLLLLDELWQVVELLLHLGQSGERDLLELAVDLHHVLLELFDEEEDILAFLTARIDEVIGLRAPVVTPDTWLDSSI